MRSLNDKEKCCGCGACMQICPRNCIEMKMDAEGFLYPVIDEGNCIHCKLCEKVCSFQERNRSNRSVDYSKNEIEAYAAYNHNLKERMESSSGGIFCLLAQRVIRQGGVVYGVAMSEDCKSAEYIRVTELSDIIKLQGSKYLQAIVGCAYKEVKKDLEDGKIVLFSGTGCQINGLKFFLRNDYDNLVCIDVICHGVPSPQLWKKYVEAIEDENHGKIVYVNFRCKEKNWQNFGLQELIMMQQNNSDEPENGALIPKFETMHDNPFMQMFLRDYCLRPSCYNCVAKQHKYSDLTIADFWGIEDVIPDMNDGRGTSLVLVRTNKGKSLFEEIDYNLCVKKVTYDDGVRCNPAEYKSAWKPRERKRFFHEMSDLSFHELSKKYAGPIREPLRRKLKQAFINADVIKRNHIRKNNGGGKSKQ